MPKLTDTQLVILNTAAGRDGHAVMPLPKSLKVNKGTATSVLKAMLAKGLIEERQAKPSEEAWRRDDDGRSITLTLTETGLTALDGASNKAAPPHPTKPATAAATPPKGTKRPGKVDTILALVRRPEGARLADLQEATGWQPHSVRAALTSLRKRGLNITRAKVDDTTVYHAKAA